MGRWREEPHFSLFLPPKSREGAQVIWVEGIIAGQRRGLQGHAEDMRAVEERARPRTPQMAAGRNGRDRDSEKEDGWWSDRWSGVPPSGWA